ncbi:hypothetical protein Ade02nite_28650 [Paractinoplanes deccanensis]|uniref:Uncharacterized protein n=1 Tax=Paractinoplanes deccanensis TaxID=113561 RepID=A0ABQ3Y2K7_9ACTN|nr:hypothetical protein [Actinoplanes deccanensis]GID74224.1 hypothetical protein Ade02nite_28650 [Actinoplanes deccanensis]
MSDPQPLLSMPSYVPGTTLNDTTRQLCGAPYLDPDFANAVIREVVESERKAVPPSYGFDLDPVVRHCLRARRLLLIRYAVVTALLIAGLCANSIATIAWLGFAAIVVFLRSSAYRELPRAMRLAGLAALAGLVFCFLGYLLLQVVAAGFIASAGFSVPDDPFDDYGSTSSGLLAGGVQTFLLVSPLALAIAMGAALFLSRRQAYGILTTELAPGVPPVVPRGHNPRVEWRLGVVAAMQRGNICVQDTDPYAGAGFIEHSWSFAVTLRPSAGDDGRVALDTAALNRRVHDAVLGLRDERLRAGERIPNIYVVPYVAADGNRRADDPLIDPQTRTPRTLASPETIDAIMASPQGGLRHYLRAVIPASGKEIRTPDGRLVLPAQDSGIGVTAFIHLAVEGGMLYTEFVCTVMPQVRPLYQFVDNVRPERVTAHAVADTLSNFLRDNVLGPVHLMRLAWDTLRLPSRMARSGRSADEFRFYDYGAHFSVRELASQRPTVKFMQVLDAEKYVKLLDRVVNETVLDHLADSGVDTTEFRAAVASVSIENATFHGGQQSFGGRTVNIQHNAPGGSRA